MNNLLKNGKIFKLILGAGNEDIESIKRLVSLYKHAEVDIFDVRADVEIINAVSDLISDDQRLCASLALGDDVHIQKARINSNCINCNRCAVACIQNAIMYKNSLTQVMEERCVGCNKCASICPHNAIDFYSKSQDYKTLFDSIKDTKIAYIEVHLTDEGPIIYECFDYMNKHFEGELGVCISGQILSIEQQCRIIKKLQDVVCSKKIIVQVDGASMSGFDNTRVTTQKAIEVSKYLNQQLDNKFIFASGGTNSLTSKLAKEHNVRLDGVSIGTYARKIVSDFIYRDDFYSDEVFTLALSKAKALVQDVKQYL